MNQRQDNKFKPMSQSEGSTRRFYKTTEFGAKTGSTKFIPGQPGNSNRTFGRSTTGSFTRNTTGQAGVGRFSPGTGSSGQKSFGGTGTSNGTGPQNPFKPRTGAYGGGGTPSTSGGKGKTRKSSGTLTALLLLVLIIAGGAFIWARIREGGANVKPSAPSVTSVPVYTTAPAVTTPPLTAEPQPAYEQDAVYRFYRSCLTGEMLSAYDQIVAEVSQEKTTAHISMNGNGWSDKLGDVVDAVRYDHPEFFWLEGGMSYSYYEENGREIYDIDLYSAYSESEIPAVNKKIDNICRPVIASLENASQYEKVLGVYEYLIDHTIYDLNYGAQNMSSVLVDGRGVCVGYSTALDYLLKELGIRCIAIGGEAGGGGHAWNLVEINGEWYEIDPTWGDPVTGDGTQTKTFHYFCITDEEMGRDHSLGDWYRSYPLPKCSATSCNYYRMNGRYLESFDRDTIIKWVQEDSPQGKATVFKCANASVHSQVVRLFDSDGIWKLRGTLPESYKCVSWDGEDSVQLICSIQFSKK